MPSTLPSSTAVEPIAVPLRDATRIAGLSKHKLRGAIDDGAVEAKKHGSQTLVLLASLRAYVESLPDYVPHTPTPESRQMIEARKRLAARRRAARAEREAEVIK